MASPRPTTAITAVLPPHKHVVVCGLGRFGLRIVELLHDANVPTVVITDPGMRPDRKRRATQLGARIVEGDYRFPEVRAEAEVATAGAVVLAASADSSNLECALDIRREQPDVRIVMRLQSDKLASRLQSDFGIHAVLSPPVLAAPAFVRAALQPPPSPNGAGATAAVRSPRPGLPTKEILLRLNPLDGRRDVRSVMLLLGLMFVFAVVIFHNHMQLSWLDAIYFASTVVTTVGFGDHNLSDTEPMVKIFGILLMFGGVTLIAIVSSLLTNFLLSGALVQYRSERIARRSHGHIIVCGLGSVGLEVAADLKRRKVPLVVVDSTPNDLHARILTARIPILVGDATNPETLQRAGVARAKALIVITSDDAVNLEIGLTAQSVVEEAGRERPLRIVLRCFDPDLRRRIEHLSRAYTMLSSAEIAAPIFVKEALAGSIHGNLPFGQGA